MISAGYYNLQLDEADKSNGVMIIGTTNVPWDLHPEVLKQFKKKIYVPLLEEEGRKELLIKQMAQVKHLLTDKDFESIAAMLKG